MSSAVTAGLLSISGVVAGATSTALITEVRDRSRAKRDAGKAGLIAAADIEHALEAVSDAKSAGESSDWAGQWPAGWDRVGWTESWSGYREILAEALDDSAFSTVARAFGSLVQLEKGLASVHAFNVDDDPRFLRRVERRLKAAQGVLPAADKQLNETVRAEDVQARGPTGDSL